MPTPARLAALLFGVMLVRPGAALAGSAASRSPGQREGSIQPRAGDPERAAALPVGRAAELLSRFEAGGVPDLPAVVDAVEVLGASGDRGVLDLLDDLALRESGLVHHAASHAADKIRARLRAEQRAAFRDALPSTDDERRWVREHSDAAGPPGPVEARAMAYARLVLDVGDQPVNLDDDPAWDVVGVALEDAGDPRGALLVYAAALAHGRRAAAAEIDAFGVDPGRLVLGLRAGVPIPDGQGLVQHRLDTVCDAGTEPAAAVLIERVAASRAEVRADAITDLGTLLRRGRLGAATASIARARLEAARQDPQPTVQEIARDAIVELELSELLPP